MIGVGPSNPEKSHARGAASASPPPHFRIADLPIELQHLVIEQATQ